jgi:hypothetical protein
MPRPRRNRGFVGRILGHGRGRHEAEQHRDQHQATNRRCGEQPIRNAEISVAHRSQNTGNGPQVNWLLPAKRDYLPM